MTEPIHSFELPKRPESFTRPESLKRPDSFRKTPRASVFYEHNDAPTPDGWGRDSPSVHGGARSPTFTDNFESGSRISSQQDGHYGGFEPVERGRVPRDFYEMPERYGGIETTYGSQIAIPLAGNNNTWVPPVMRRKRWCGLGKTAIWILSGVVCLLVVCGIVGGIVAGVASKKPSGHISTSSTLAVPAPTFQASTTTLPNGSVVLTTHVFTLTQTTASHTTTTTPASSSAVTTSSTLSSSSRATSAPITSSSTSETSSSSILLTTASSVTSSIKEPSSSTALPTISARMLLSWP